MYINAEKLNKAAGKILCPDCGWRGICTDKNKKCPECKKDNLVFIEKIT